MSEEVSLNQIYESIQKLTGIVTGVVSRMDNLESSFVRLETKQAVIENNSIESSNGLAVFSSDFDKRLELMQATISSLATRMELYEKNNNSSKVSYFMESDARSKFSSSVKGEEKEYPQEKEQLSLEENLFNGECVSTRSTSASGLYITEDKVEYEKVNSYNSGDNLIKNSESCKAVLNKYSSLKYRYEDTLFYNDVDSTLVSFDTARKPSCDLFFDRELGNITLAAALHFFYFKFKKKEENSYFRNLSLIFGKDLYSEWCNYSYDKKLDFYLTDKEQCRCCYANFKNEFTASFISTLVFLISDLEFSFISLLLKFKYFIISNYIEFSLYKKAEAGINTKAASSVWLSDLVFSFSSYLESTKQVSRKFLENSLVSWLSNLEFSFKNSSLVVVVMQSASEVQTSQLTEQQISSILGDLSHRLSSEFNQPVVLSLLSYSSGSLHLFQALDQSDRFQFKYVLDVLLYHVFHNQSQNLYGLLRFDLNFRYHSIAAVFPDLLRRYLMFIYENTPQ